MFDRCGMTRSAISCCRSAYCRYSALSSCHRLSSWTTLAAIRPPTSLGPWRQGCRAVPHCPAEASPPARVDCGSPPERAPPPLEPPDRAAEGVGEGEAEGWARRLSCRRRRHPLARPMHVITMSGNHLAQYPASITQDAIIFTGQGVSFQNQLAQYVETEVELVRGDQSKIGCHHSSLTYQRHLSSSA